MADELIVFSEGEKITAEDTNDNNRYLAKLNSQSAEELQAYLDTEMDKINEDLNNTITSQVSGLQTQINSVKTTANGKISATQSKGSNGYCKLSNGIIIQWGRQGSMGNGTSKTITFPTAFSSANYSISGATSYVQGAGDKRSSWYVNGFSSSKFVLNSRFEQSSSNTIYWCAVGY